MFEAARLSRVCLALAVGLLAIAAVGCGGDSADGSDAEPLTKAQYIEEGEKICKKIDKAQMTAFLDFQNENPKRVESKPGREELILTAGLPSVEKGIEEFRELGVPEGDEEEVEKFLSAMEVALDEAKDDPLLVAESESGLTPFDQPDAIAKKYGFVACSDTL